MSLFWRKLGYRSRQFFPKAQGNMSYFSSSSSSSISFAKYLEMKESPVSVIWKKKWGDNFVLSGLNLSTDFGKIQEILKIPQRPTSFDTILKLLCKPESLLRCWAPLSWPPVPSRQRKSFYWYLQCYEEIHSVKFPFRQFGSPKVGVNHCQKILKRKDKFILRFKVLLAKKNHRCTTHFVWYNCATVHPQEILNDIIICIIDGKKLIKWTLVLFFLCVCVKSL